MRKKRIGMFVALLGLAFVAGAADDAKGAAKLAPEFDYKAILQGKVEEPVDLEFSPDGLLWVTCRRGQIWVYDSTKDTATKITKVDVDHSRERGLHGIAFHPDYAKNGLFFLYYATHTEDGHFNNLTLWKATTTDGKIKVKEQKVLFQIPSEETSFHEGGAVRYNKKDGKLYFTMGDNLESPKTKTFFEDPKAFPQNLKDLRGKTFRLNLDGSVPKDNPFVGRDDARPEIFTYGHRNPYSLSIDDATGDVFVGEVGFDEEQSAEEHNKLVPGGNYGWPLCQGANRGTFGGECKLKGAIDPFFWYFRGPGASTTIGPIVGNENPVVKALGLKDGKGVFYGDMSRRWVRFAPLSADGKGVAKSLPVASGLGGGPLAFRTGPDGALYFVEYGGFFNATPADKVGRIAPKKEVVTGKTTELKSSVELLGHDETGVALTNTQPCALTVTVTAEGRWSYAKELESGPEGLTTAPPVPQGFALPGAAPGALVVRRAEGKTALVGKGADVKLAKGETVRFVMNDAPSGLGGGTYDDNEGALTLRFTHDGCK